MAWNRNGFGGRSDVRRADLKVYYLFWLREDVARRYDFQTVNAHEHNNTYTCIISRYVCILAQMEAECILLLSRSRYKNDPFDGGETSFDMQVGSRESVARRTILFLRKTERERERKKYVERTYHDRTVQQTNKLGPSVRSTCAFEFWRRPFGSALSGE